MNIAFIGLGIMGSRMAANLLKGEHTVYVYNRTAAKSRELASHGAKIYRDIREINNAHVVFTMLSTPEVVREMAIGKNGFLQFMREKSVWVDCSTVNPSFSREMYLEARSEYIRFMDAPVAGSLGPAERGELIFMAGGREKELEIVRPLFEMMGKKIIHAGSHGMGSAMKMVVNLVMGHAMAGFAEGMALGQAMGIDRQLLLDTLLSTPVVAPIVAVKRKKIEEEDYSPEFPLQWLHKDLHLALQTAYEFETPMPATHAVKEVFSLARAMGYGEKDISAIVAAVLSQVRKPE